MFAFRIYQIKKPNGETKTAFYFGIFHIMNELTEGDLSDIPDSQLTEWQEKLLAGRAVNYRGVIIRLACPNLEG